MVPALSLWLPILLSAVLVFIASSIIHMVLTYHRSDYKKLEDENQVMQALRKFDISPGEYVMPFANSGKEMGTPEFVEKLKQGPVAFLTFLPSGPPAMTKNLVQWFIYCVVVGFFAAYIAGRALEPGAPYLAVFRFVGASAFVGYSLALWQNSIWYKRSWTTTLKSNFDGFIYASLTAGVFGWLWPD